MTIALADDQVREGNETIVLTLSNPGGGAVLGALRVTTLTITDNEVGPTVQFGAIAYAVARGGWQRHPHRDPHRQHRGGPERAGEHGHGRWRPGGDPGPALRHVLQSGVPVRRRPGEHQRAGDDLPRQRQCRRAHVRRRAGERLGGAERGRAAPGGGDDPRRRRGDQPHDFQPDGDRGRHGCAHRAAARLHVHHVHRALRDVQRFGRRPRRLHGQVGRPHLRPRREQPADLHRDDERPAGRGPQDLHGDAEPGDRRIPGPRQRGVRDDPGQRHAEHRAVRRPGLQRPRGRPRHDHRHPHGGQPRTRHRQRPHLDDQRHRDGRRSTGPGHRLHHQVHDAHLRRGRDQPDLHGADPGRHAPGGPGDGPPGAPGAATGLAGDARRPVDGDADDRGRRAGTLPVHRAGGDGE